MTAAETRREDFHEPSFRTKTIAQFWPRADEARERFEGFMGDWKSHGFSTAHQCWDYWYVPHAYSYLRTDPSKIIGKELVVDFNQRLRELCISQLAGLTATTPWLTLHTNGMRHELHNDSRNGTYGYVFSLTRQTRFAGGETCIVREEAFANQEHREFAAWSKYFEVFQPSYNQLLLFDDRAPHMVPVVQGTLDPLEGRLCLTGHIR